MLREPGEIGTALSMEMHREPGKMGTDLTRDVEAVDFQAASTASASASASNL